MNRYLVLPHLLPRIPCMNRDPLAGGGFRMKALCRNGFSAFVTFF